MARPFLAAALAFSILFAAVPAALAQSAQPTVRQVSQTTAGPWTVFGWMRSDNIRYCSAERDVGAVRIAFIRLPQGYALLMRSPSWQLDPNSPVPVHVARQLGQTSMSGVVIGTNIVLVQFDSNLMRYIAEQPQIAVTAANLTVTIPLDSITAAISALEGCMTATTAPQPASTPPSAPQPPSQPQRSAPAPILPKEGPSVQKPQSSATMSPVRGPIQVP
jgi:hypothetical protein